MDIHENLGYDPNEWEECPPPDHFLAFGIFTRVWLSFCAIAFCILFFWIMESRKRNKKDTDYSLEFSQKHESPTAHNLDKIVEETKEKQRSRTATPNRRSNWERELREVENRRLRASEEPEPLTETFIGEDFELSATAFDNLSTLNDLEPNLKNIERVRLTEHSLCATPPSTPENLASSNNNNKVGQQMAADLHKKLMAQREQQSLLKEEEVLLPNLSVEQQKEKPFNEFLNDSELTEDDKIFNNQKDLEDSLYLEKEQKFDSQETMVLKKSDIPKGTSLLDEQKNRSSSSEEGFVKVYQNPQGDQPTRRRLKYKEKMPVLIRSVAIDDDVIPTTFEDWSTERKNLEVVNNSNNSATISPYTIDEWSDRESGVLENRQQKETSVDIDDTVTADDIEFVQNVLDSHDNNYLFKPVNDFNGNPDIVITIPDQIELRNQQYSEKIPSSSVPKNLDQYAENEAAQVFKLLQEYHDFDLKQTFGIFIYINNYFLGDTQISINEEPTQQQHFFAVSNKNSSIESEKNPEEKSNFLNDQNMNKKISPNEVQKWTHFDEEMENKKDDKNTIFETQTMRHFPKSSEHSVHTLNELRKKTENDIQAETFLQVIF